LSLNNLYGEKTVDHKLRRIWTLALALFALSAVAALAADAAPEPFRDGDRVCFIGDSITHGGNYHSFIFLFYATRFPERQIEVFNCGISGDSAGGAVRRFDWDIAAHEPTVSTIMLGMNDVNRGLYGKDKPDEANLKQRQAAIDGHVANMRKLAEALRGKGSRLIFITPSIYDQTATLATENLFGVNDALGVCGAQARALAAEFGGSLVDFHGVMTRLNAEVQKADPAATIVGKDRVHPGAMGHLVMAYVFLKAQGLSPYVSKTVIDAGSGKAVETENVSLQEIAATPERVSFVSLEKALPFPLPAGAEGAVKLVPFMQDLDQQVLSVTNLAPGAYELLIDDAAVGEYSTGDLAAGINLADNAKTPQYQQAKTVAAANDKRHALIAGKLRSFALTEIYLKGVKDLDLNDSAAVAKALTERIEKMKASGSPTAGYYEGQAKLYIAEKAKEADYRRDADAALSTMRTANRPAPHRFLLRKKP
jgi:lysophospholipase L1-like esterase